MALFYGKTVEEAIENALKELNINKEQALIEVLEEPQKGFLGIGTKEAKVKVEKKKDDGEVQ
jgi:spoIIIJ-associated protein